MIAKTKVVLYHHHPTGKCLYPPPEEHRHPNGLSELSWRAQQQECISLLKKCKTMSEFKQIHGQFLKLGFLSSSFSIGNLLATCALSSWGNMEHAASIFHHIDDPDSFEYNTMIRGHVKDSDFQQGLVLFVDMLEEGVAPDNYTYPFTLKACGGLNCPELGVQIHGQVFKLGFRDDVISQNGLINMYGRCGRIDEARAIFKQMEGIRSLASWGSLISAHVNLGMWWECIDLFLEMMSEQGYNNRRLGTDGLSILVSVLSACTHLGAFDLGRSIHAYLIRNTVCSNLNVIVETSLMDMYLKCGSVQKGLHIFKTMGEEKKNQQSYSVIISGLAMHGFGEKALEIFSGMLEKGLNPDDVIYLSVLSACRHSGLVQQGNFFFNKMKSDHGIEPTIQHYGCMVDLLARAGRLEEAIELIMSKMPMQANDVIWRSLLSASKVHHNLRIGEIAAKKLMSLGTENSGDYVLMASIYAQAKKWEDMAIARRQIARKGLDQEPGFCMVEIGRKIYNFVSQDRKHPNWVEMYDMIHQMEWQLRVEGYVADLSEVVYDIDEEEKRERLRYHSQKLALAFALIKTSKEAVIRIVRNVRMCRDCHTYAKLISVVYGREIVIRDRNRFHHIKAGCCSCKDYW